MNLKDHPLAVHSFVLMLVGVGVLVYAIVLAVGAAKTASESRPAATTSTGLGGVQGATQEAQRAISDARTTATDAKSLATAARRPSLSGAMTGLQTASRLAVKAEAAKVYLVPIGIGLLGLGLGAMGFFVLQRANWARFVGFGLLAATILIFAARQGIAMGDRREPIVFPLIALVIVTPLAAKFLWDLFVEKFEEA